MLDLIISYKILDIVFGDLSLASKVSFVSYQRYSHFFMRMGLYFSKPMPSILKALLGGEIEHQQNSNRAFVVGASDGFEGLLASSVPNLQFDVLVPPADNP